MRRRQLLTALGAVPGLTGCLGVGGSGGSQQKMNAATDTATDSATATASETSSATASATESPTATATPTPTPGWTVEYLRFALFQAINDARRKTNSGVLVQNESLQEVAQERAKALANNESVKGASLRLQAVGCEDGAELTTSTGRGTAVSDPSGSGTIYVDEPQEVVDISVGKWEQVGNGRTKMLKPKYAEVGIGVVVKESWVYFAVDFCI